MPPAAALSAIAAEPFDAKAAARDELEWWIIRRERDQYTTSDWERFIAGVASTIYHRPPDAIGEYAKLRVQAMSFRDERGENITEADWTTIREMLERAWTALAAAVRPTS